MKSKFVVPCVAPELELNGQIAIIGSSGKMKNVKHGQEIDRYDEVIRFNRAPCEGYEEYVGSKTTLRIVNNHVFNNNDIKHEGYTNQPANFVRDLRNSRILYFASDLAPWAAKDTNTHSSNELHLFDYRCASVIKQHFNYPSDKFPTLGVGFICLCVMNGIVPSLFGFDTENRRRDHYWEDRPRESSYHGVNHEKELLKELDKQVKVRLYG
tara:strand:+ start:288 stop:920 length:633 start_codon:yes stop_codon:yes gene_type:complete